MASKRHHAPKTAIRDARAQLEAKRRLVGLRELHRADPEIINAATGYEVLEKAGVIGHAEIALRAIKLEARELIDRAEQGDVGGITLFVATHGAGLFADATRRWQRQRDDPAQGVEARENAKRALKAVASGLTKEGSGRPPESQRRAVEPGRLLDRYQELHSACRDFCGEHCYDPDNVYMMGNLDALLRLVPKSLHREARELIDAEVSAGGKAPAKLAESLLGLELRLTRSRVRRELTQARKQSPVAH